MRLPLSGLGDVGWLPDQRSFELPANAVTDLQNMRMRDGWAQKVDGYQQVFAATNSTPYFVTPFATAGFRALVHATATSVLVDTGTRYDISPVAPLTPLTSVMRNAWTATVMNGILVMNNRADQPMYWTGDTSSTLAVLPGWSANDRARTISSTRYHWVAMGITRSGVSYPHRVKISAAAEPGSPGTSWDQTDPTVDAYEADVVGDGVLVWGLPLGDGLVLYKEKSMALLRYTGDPQQIWSIQPLTIPYGMLAPNCGVAVPGIGHVVFARDDVIMHDGVNAQSILDSKARTWLRNNLDPVTFAQSFVVADYSLSEVHICFPARGNAFCTKAIIWNWKTQALGQKNLPSATCGCTASFDYALETFDSDSVSFDSESTLTFDSSAEIFGAYESRVVMGTTAAKLYAMDSTSLADGAPFTAYVEFGALCNVNEGLKGRQLLLTGCWLDIDADPGTQISVYFGSATEPGVAFTYAPAFTFTVGTDRKADAIVCGPYIAIKLQSDSYFRVRSLFPEITDEGIY